jgi:hypothetical protein
MIYTAAKLIDRIATEEAQADRVRTQGAEPRAIYLDGYKNGLVEALPTVEAQAAEIEKLKELLGMKKPFEHKHNFKNGFYCATCGESMF